MNNDIYIVKKTKQFKQEYKRCISRGLNIELLNRVLYALIYKIPLEPKYKDHSLIGNYKGYRECHIQNDWLLIYKIVHDENTIILTRTGTHSDLFR